MKDRGVAPRRGPLHDARAAHLALATVAAELADDLGDRVPARHVGLREPSRARSALVTSTTAAPSETRQQSKRCSGSTTNRDAWWSSSVSGDRMMAAGLSAACLRNAIGTAPSSALVAP